MYTPIFRISPRLLTLLIQATELRLDIKRSAIQVPWLSALKNDTSTRLAHSSTAIEGNPLSLKQTNLLAMGVPVLAEEKSKLEVLDYLKALHWIEKDVIGSALTERKLLNMHKFLTRNTLAKHIVGLYKTTNNRIIDAKGITIYTPPGPKQSRALTQNFLAWLNRKDTHDIHPIIVSAIAHHRLLSIHPFMDGNGRTARLLAMWVLYTRDFDTNHIFALDEFFESDRHKYYLKIQQVRELDNDLTYWLEYITDALIDTLKRTRERITYLNIKTKNSNLILSKRQEEVLRFIQENGRVKSPDIEKAFGLTRSRVNQLIKPLVEASVLSREGQTRATFYRIK